MQHIELIERLGGPKALREMLGTTRTAPYNWRRNGIPWRYRHTIAKFARRRRIPLPADFLIETTIAAGNGA